MFFVVDKPRLQRMIGIVREDRSRPDEGPDLPFLRLAAVGSELGSTVGATHGQTRALHDQGQGDLYQQDVGDDRGEVMDLSSILESMGFELGA